MKDPAGSSAIEVVNLFLHCQLLPATFDLIIRNIITFA